MRREERRYLKRRIKRNPDEVGELFRALLHQRLPPAEAKRAKKLYRRHAALEKLEAPYVAKAVREARRKAVERRRQDFLERRATGAATVKAPDDGPRCKPIIGTRTCKRCGAHYYSYQQVACAASGNSESEDGGAG